MFKEFGDFLQRGNVIDLAVGVVIGAAFTKIVTALVDKLIMPIVGILIGGVNFETLSIKVGDAVLGWGAVVQEIVNFVIVAFVLFLIIKAYNHSMKANFTMKMPDHLEPETK